jgi:hypothetical protein
MVAHGADALRNGDWDVLTEHLEDVAHNGLYRRNAATAGLRGAFLKVDRLSQIHRKRAP